MLAPYSSSTRRSSSMKGQPRCCASMRPSVDLPAPRRPTSAMRRRAIGTAARADARLDLLGQRRQFALPAPARARSRMAPRAAVRAPVSGRSAAVGRSSACAIARSTLDGRIAGAALDLRQIALRGLATLAPIAGASCRAWRGCSALRARSRRGMRPASALGRWRSGNRAFAGAPFWPSAWPRSCALMHYSSCAIMHLRR